MKRQVGIVGAGHVGAEVASEILRMNIADCVFVDVDLDRARAKALDLTQAAPLRGSSGRVVEGDGLRALRDCAVVVLAAGVPRGPGMTREDLLDINCAIMQDVVPRLVSVVPEAVLLVVTNPLDAMTYAAWKLSGKDARSVFGMAGALDAARFRSFLAGELNVSAEDVHAIVLGSHGDLMVPLVRYASVGGIPARDLLSPGAAARILESTRHAGTELVSLLKTGSAWYAAGASVAAIVDSILNDKRRVFSCSVLCRGEYGIEGVCVGVPTVIGAAGVERILVLELDEAESKMLGASVEHLGMLQEDVDRRIGTQPAS
jgi:malate dehydrogenase